MKGWVCFISNRYGKANSKYLQSYGPNKNLIYLKKTLYT